MCTITIEGLDEAITSWIDKEANHRGISVEMMVIQLIQKGIKAETEDLQLPVYSDLDALAGTWSGEESDEFLKVIADFEQVDERLWQ